MSVMGYLLALALGLAVGFVAAFLMVGSRRGTDDTSAETDPGQRTPATAPTSPAAAGMLPAVTDTRAEQNSAEHSAPVAPPVTDAETPASSQVRSADSPEPADAAADQTGTAGGTADPAAASAEVSPVFEELVSLLRSSQQGQLPQSALSGSTTTTGADATDVAVGEVEAQAMAALRRTITRFTAQVDSLKTELRRAQRNERLLGERVEEESARVRKLSEDLARRDSRAGSLLADPDAR